MIEHVVNGSAFLRRSAAFPYASLPTRRRFLIGAGGLILITAAACGGDGAATGEDGAVIAATSTYPRKVTDAAGRRTTLPARPQRIVCLANLGDLDALLSLGVAPVQFGIRSFVGEYTGSPSVSWPWHETALDKFESEIQRVNGDATNLETVALARPDLIVGLQFWIEEAREQLEAIAPVVQLKFNWRDNLRMLGTALALESQAAQLIETTDQRIAAALDGFDVGSPSVAIISSYDGATFNFFGHASDGRVDLFQRAGFALLDDLAAQTSADAPIIQELSLEVIDQLAPADVIVLFDYGNDGVNPSGILDNPLFKQLPAVQADRLIVLTQGELAQGLSTISPLNIDFCLNIVRQAAETLT